jgi:hypothetical protein
MKMFNRIMGIKHPTSLRPPKLERAKVGFSGIAFIQACGGGHQSEARKSEGGLFLVLLLFRHAEADINPKLERAKAGFFWYCFYSGVRRRTSTRSSKERRRAFFGIAFIQVVRRQTSTQSSIERRRAFSAQPSGVILDASF